MDPPGDGGVQVPVLVPARSHDIGVKFAVRRQAVSTAFRSAALRQASAMPLESKRLKPGLQVGLRRLGSPFPAKTGIADPAERHFRTRYIDAVDSQHA